MRAGGTDAAAHLASGRRGEAVAARFLVHSGCTVLLRNYRCRTGEIDIVASDDDGTVLIVEVRLRSRGDFGSAAESVTLHKRRRLVRASRHLLAMRPGLARHPVRFDVIEVTPRTGGDDTVHWIRHAFECT